MIRVKNKKQLDGIRYSCKLLSEVYSVVIHNINPGATTEDLDKITREEIAKRNSKPAFLGYMGFPAALCTSLNNQVIHGIPSSKTVLKEGDILSLDCGVIHNGFYSDAAVTIPVGKISNDAEKLLKITKESLYKGIEKARVGNRLMEISRAVYNHVTGNNMGVVREFCGHGIGMSLHEDPQIPNYVNNGPNPRLKEGMVFAIEPMINAGTWKVNVLDDGWTVETQDGSLSAHFEHTIAILKDKAEILTGWKA